MEMVTGTDMETEMGKDMGTIEMRLETELDLIKRN